MLGFISSAEKRRARFVSCALLRSRASARSAERPGRHARAIRKRPDAGMGENKTRAGKEPLADYTERFSGGVKVNLDVPDPVKISGRT